MVRFEGKIRRGQGSPEMDWPQDSAPPVEIDFLLQDFGVQLPGPVQPDSSQDRIPSAEDTSDDFSPPRDVPAIEMPEQTVEVANDAPREEQIDKRLRDAAREAIRRIKSRQQ
jgi:hypothetical protein